MRYIALLRGINVGGNNKISMAELKEEFELAGLTNVATYINSGNILFDSNLDESAVKTSCETAIIKRFSLDIPVGIITANEIIDAIAHAPKWWNDDADSKHNAIFVIPPMAAEEVCSSVAEIKPEYEKVEYYGKVIFWSAPKATFSRTRFSKIVQNKEIYRSITIRNANTTLKLANMSGGKM